MQPTLVWGEVPPPLRPKCGATPDRQQEAVTLPSSIPAAGPNALPNLGPMAGNAANNGACKPLVG